MRILLCSKRDLTSVVILNDLLSRLRQIPQCLVYLILAERTRKVETTVPELVHMKMIERDLPFSLFFPMIDGDATGSLGGPAALEAAFARLNVPPAARPSPVSAERLMTLNRLIEHHRIPCQVVGSMTDSNLRLPTEALTPDLILSVRFSFIFPPAFVALAKHGVINVHPGAVPAYAGLYPHFHSMLAGEKTLGCTVHFVDEEIDSGAVLASGEVPIDRDRSAFDHNLASHLLGNRLVVDVIEKLARGVPLQATQQDRSRIIQHTYPTPTEFAAFQMKGLNLVDMNEYRDLLWRFGLFERALALSDDERLPESRDSDRITTTYRG